MEIKFLLFNSLDSSRFIIESLPCAAPLPVGGKPAALHEVPMKETCRSSGLLLKLLPFLGFRC